MVSELLQVATHLIVHLRDHADLLRFWGARVDLRLGPLQSGRGAVLHHGREGSSQRLCAQGVLLDRVGPQQELSRPVLRGSWWMLLHRSQI